MKKNTGEVKEASYRCSEMKPKPDTVHMVNKLTLTLQPLWRGCSKPLLSSRKVCYIAMSVFVDFFFFLGFMKVCPLWYDRKHKTLEQFSSKGHRDRYHSSG